MEKYAVIKTSGRQYKVGEGDVIEVDRIAQTPNSEIEFDQVLLYVDGKKVQVGKPTLPLKVKAFVIENFRGEKIRVFKYKAKTQYRRTTGHRQDLTKVKIEKFEEVK